MADPVRGRSGRPRDTSVLGGVLILLGVLFLVGRLTSIDLGHYGWPLFVIVPGVLILLFASGDRGAISEARAIAGSIVTVTGLILLYQNSTDRFESWAYAWTLIFPGAVGAGMIIYGLRTGRPGNVRAGLRLLQVALVLFVVGVIFFELILGIGGIRVGASGGVILSVLVIVAGVLLLVVNLPARFRRLSR